MVERSVPTQQKEQLINITHLINEELQKSSVKNGIATVFVPHTTAGVTINENADPDVQRDIIMGLRSFQLEKQPFRHMEGNSPAHIKASLMGSSIQIIIKGGRLMLGTWQGIYYCEFDGPRNRKVWLKFLESTS
ncbi:MAG: secondary thiamine-phosphate synthase enzyme YjbQ [Spirochaetes bacterium]|nr:secondary thiamine-phosphate synthase enzyme YjbQ [Spirochaetota bacterium]